MATRVHNEKPIDWSFSQSDEWERTYTVTHLVKGERNVDGLYNASRAVGLPTVGSVWLFNGDLDPWAFCRPSKEVRRHKPAQGEIDEWFTVTQTFSTEPLKRCQDDEVTDPLLQPPKLSGVTQHDKEEAMYDRSGKPIVNSAHEQIRGPQNEWSVSRSQYIVEQNVILLERELIEPMRDTLNDAPMWGFPARSIKLSDFKWSERYYGTCFQYFNRQLVFDVRVRRLNLFNPFPIPGMEPIPGPLGTLLIGDWDRDLLDEGTKCLNGQFVPEKGEGCTLTVTVDPDDGSVLDAIITAPGGKYPKSKIVPLFIVNSVPGGQSGAVVLVNTDADGTATSVARIQLPGIGYVAGPKTTIQRGFWVLLPIGGEVPHYDNPQHFMRFQDPKGNMSRCLLDGRGMPIAANETPGSIHVEKSDTSNFLVLGVPDLPG